MSDMLSYWQADVKIGGQPLSVVWEDGDWSATGDGADVLLSRLQDEVASREATLDYNPYVTARLGDLFAESLRAVSLVYGIDTNFGRDDDVPDDAVI